MSNFILHDILIKDIETKKIYTFNPSETTATIVNDELYVLTNNERDDIKNTNELNTFSRYIHRRGV